MEGPSQKPHLDTRMESHQDSRKPSGDVSVRKKGSHGGQHFCCVMVNNLINIFICCAGLCTLPHFFWITGEALL